MTKLSTAEILQLPLVAYKGAIIVVKDDTVLESVLPQLLKEPVLGFDVETPPCFSKGVQNQATLLQLSTDKCAWLFQLKYLKKLDKLFSILANKDIIKAGIAFSRDVKDLQALCSFEAAGFVELASMSNAVGIENNGLQGVFAACFGHRVSKSKKIQLSNWGQKRLSVSQQKYAATDAWCCYNIYQYLVKTLASQE